SESLQHELVLILIARGRGTAIYESTSSSRLVIYVIERSRALCKAIYFQKTLTYRYTSSFTRYHLWLLHRHENSSCFTNKGFRASDRFAIKPAPASK